MKKLLGVGLAFALALCGAASADVAIYDAIPDLDYSLQENVPPSLGYQATQTNEAGDHIAFEPGTSRTLSSATFGLVSWAQYDAVLNDSSLQYDADGWWQDVTLNLYGVASDGDGNPAVGGLLYSFTESFYIPFSSTGWIGDDTDEGMWSPITYDLTSYGDVNVGDEIIFGIAFNTSHYGEDPTGLQGPYNSLNLGLFDDYGATIGTDVEEDAIFWNTETAGWYTDGGAGGVGTFRRDTNWAPYTVAAEFDAVAPVPLPAAAGLGLLGLGLLGVMRKKRARK